MSPKAVNEHDRQIGDRIRQSRLAKGLSQTELAAKLGITFQQLQKYEKGTNRISASRLQVLADVLDMPVAVFYGHRRETPLPDDPDTLRLMRAFQEIADARLRALAIRLLEMMAKAA